jgi:hypothetical protein
MSKTKIPDKHYVGLLVRSNDAMPLGFITPWGEDDKAKQRIQTVDSWARQGRQGAIPTSVVENVPMRGFRLTSAIRTGRFGSVDKWRIEDPRGFEVEISSENLASIISETTIENGEILNKCIWARKSSSNVLLAVGSEEYNDAVDMTSIASTSVATKDIKPGYRIVLQNGTTGRYLGKFHLVQIVGASLNAEVENLIRTSSSPYHAVVSDVDNMPWTKAKQNLQLSSSLKVSRIEGTEELGKKDAELIVNDLIISDDVLLNSSVFKQSAIIASSKKIKVIDLKIFFEEANEVSDPWSRNQNLSVFIETVGGAIGMVDRIGHGSNTIKLIRTDLIKDTILAFETKQNLRAPMSSYRQQLPYRANTMKVEDADIGKVLKLAISYKTPEGNEFISYCV